MLDRFYICCLKQSLDVGKNYAWILVFAFACNNMQHMDLLDKTAFQVVCMSVASLCTYIHHGQGYRATHAPHRCWVGEKNIRRCL